MAISSTEQRVLDLIDDAEVLAVAQALVRAPGENPPGGEGPTAQVLAAEAGRLGLRYRIVDVTPDRPNVSIVADGGSEPGLLLLGHTDVVPIGDGWTVSPTGGEIRGGRLYGRGSTDMKGGLAAALVAMAAIQRAGVWLRGPIELAAVVDEEENGLGARALIAERAADPAAPAYRACVVAEPTDLQTIIAARGAAYFRVSVTGKAAHAGNPADGVSAIYGAAAVIGEIERWHRQLAVDARPLIGPATWNVGTVHGGTGGSIVPAECVMMVDRRLLPGDDPVQIEAELRARVDTLGLTAAGMSVAVETLMAMPGFETQADHVLVTTAHDAIREAGGPDLPLGGWTAACDGGYVQRAEGTPVIVLGPGSVQTQAHRADESVGVAELVTAARAYALISLRLLG